MMIDLQDKSIRPSIEEIGEYVRNPVFTQFCSEIKSRYGCSGRVEYSSCSWERGWNIKFRRAGKTLCTIYPREGCFTVMVVVGAKEKAPAEAVLPECTAELRRIYRETREGNGQRWLMVDLEDSGDLYRDLLRLISLRGNG